MRTVGALYGATPPGGAPTPGKLRGKVVPAFMRHLGRACPAPSRVLSLSDRMCGVEIEVEKSYPIENQVGHWQVTKDNSLRGPNAVELVTPFGTTVGQAFLMVENFHSQVLQHRKVDPEAFSFSERCSVHVHIDVRDLALKQVSKLVQLYTIFEPALFDFVGRSRRSNVFCIPLAGSQFQFQQYRVDALIEGMDKYCALNLQCVQKYGTVEFRHMHGTSDPRKIGVWLLLISSLVFAARNLPQTLIDAWRDSLKSISNYQEFCALIFGEALAGYLPINEDDLDMAVTNSKLYARE